jgi:hypothetical protein
MGGIVDKTRKENLELYKYLFLSRKYDKDDNFVFNRIRNDFLICKTTYFDFIINEIVLKEFGKENERLNKKREFELIINDKCLKKEIGLFCQKIMLLSLLRITFLIHIEKKKEV